MTNGEYIKSQVKDRDIMMVMIDGIFTDFGIFSDAWFVFTDSWLKNIKASKEDQRRIWLCWLSEQYDEKIWKEILDKYKD